MNYGQATKLIVGLGNPGKKYQNNRHNLGFMVMDELANRWAPGANSWTERKDLRSAICDTRSAILAKPLTMMNSSGLAVAKLLEFYRIPTPNLWVIHDELDLPLGIVKIQRDRGSAGHKGVESIIEGLETANFVRFRIGVGRPGEGDPDQYLLSNFSTQEKGLLKKTIGQVVKLIELALNQGWEKVSASI